MGMILRIASSRIVGQGDIVGRSGYFSLNLSANSVMRGRLDARRTLKSLVADLRITSKEVKVISAQGIILSKSKSGAILKMTVYQDGKEIYQNTVSVPDSENNTKSIQYTNIKN